MEIGANAILHALIAACQESCLRRIERCIFPACRRQAISAEAEDLCQVLHAPKWRVVERKASCVLDLDESCAKEKLLKRQTFKH